MIHVLSIAVKPRSDHLILPGHQKSRGGNMLVGSCSQSMRVRNRWNKVTFVRSSGLYTHRVKFDRHAVYVSCSNQRATQILTGSRNIMRVKLGVKYGDATSTLWDVRGPDLLWVWVLFWSGECLNAVRSEQLVSGQTPFLVYHGFT